MPTGRTVIAVIALLGTIGAGCMSAPFIDESIAKLDADPVPIEAKFDLKDTPSIASQPASRLVGDWRTGLLRPVRRFIGFDGSVYKYDDGYNGLAHDYTFNDDGSLMHYDCTQEGVMTFVLKKTGTWTYDSGVLTLHYVKEEKESQNHFAKSRGEPNWQSVSTKELDETVVCRVEWLSGNEIVLKDDEKGKGTSQPSFRESVKVDAKGVKTRREICVYGMREGREVGTVMEIISPPIRLKKVK